MTAADKGALGVLLVNPSWNKDEKITLKEIYNRSMGNVNIPVIVISQKVALSIINKSANFLNKFPVDNEPASFETKAVVSAETSFELQYQNTNNVVGYLEGSDPKLKNEYIVVGGHYDHLGMGGPSSRKPDTIAIHNGADDNASGTAGVIELARRIQADKGSFGRSFIFITFSAEELGLLGSQYFVSNPTVPIASLKGMINLDMIGRLKDELTIEGTGSSTESDSLLTILEKGRPYKVTHSAGAAGGSDHTSFYNKGVPVFFFFSGMHYDYHTPSDKADKINYKGESDILDMAYDLAKVMGTSKPLTYKQVAGQMNTGARTYRIALGIMPDVSGSRNDGVEVMDARKGGPAEQAGIRKGDVIISLEGKEVNNITEYMNRLNLLKKGEKANVGVRRNGEKITIVVQL
jgi:aminopeptidase YwaD